AEVDDLRHRLAVINGYQHVRRLEIAMDDALLMRVLNRIADLDEQLEPLFRWKLLIVAELSDRNSLHQLHCEIGAATFSATGVQHAGYVGMIHQSQCLPFGLEPGNDLPAIHARLDDLQRNAATDGLLLLGHVDHAHAPFADALKKLVRADLFSLVKR